jgi:CubicO group peptidase (beta-lactamase class C family)
MSESLVVADAAELGIDPDRLRRVDDLTHGYVDSGRLPGVVTVVGRHGRVIHHDSYGHADVKSGREVAHDDIYRIFSMTKPIASVALMMLHEEGRVLLDNPVSRFIPSFADVRVWESGTEESYVTREPDRQMTVHDVLTHMSGLTAGFQFQHPVDALYRSNGLGGLSRPEMTLEEGLDRAAELPLMFSPGDAWAYGMSTDVVGRIVEVASGQRLDDFLHTRIFEPLGMVDTDFAVPADELHRLTTMYIRRQGGGLKAVDSAGRTTIHPPPPYLSGAGGLMSTTADYHRFVQMLANQGAHEGTRLLGPRTLAYMRQNHLPGGATLNDMGQSTFAESAMNGVGFGLGFSVVVDPPALQNVASPGEFGWGGAASTIFWVDPVEELWVLFLTQLLPSATYPIRQQLRTAVNQSVVE